MIGKLIKGRGARGLLEYLLGERDHSGDIRPRVAVLGGTLDGNTITDLVRQFAALHRLRPRLGVHVVHQSLRLAPGDRVLTDDEWRAIGAEWAEGMGFDAYVIVSHGDHIHIAASRIRADGSVVSDAHDWRRSESLIRQIEQRHGLVRVEASHLLEPERATTHRKAPTIAEIALAERGETPLAEQVRDILEAALAKQPTVTEFVEFLEMHGVEVLPNLAATGKLNGFAYRFKDQDFTAKGLGRGFTLSNLLKRGLDYDQDRDLAALRRCRTRITAAALGLGDGGAATADRELERSSSADAGRPGASDAAPGRGDGATDRRDKAGAARQSSDPRGNKERPEINARTRPTTVGTTEKNATRATADLADNHHGLPVGSSVHLICDLGGVKSQSLDLTKQQVKQQIDGLACEKYEIGLIPPFGAGTPQQRTWTGEQVVKGLRWLRRMNALQYNVYIRPAPHPDGLAEPLVFVDDLNRAALDRVAADGHRWAALIESSPGRFHGWIRLAHQPLPRDVVTAAARALAKRYGGDPNSADWRHFGRLAGLTNRKPSRAQAQPDGRPPFALLRSAWNGVTAAALQLLEAVRAALRPRPEPPTPTPARIATRAPAPVLDTWQAAWARAADRTDDLSRRDAAACLACLRAGHDPADVAAAMLEASPGLRERHRDPAEYARRTVAWAQRTLDADDTPSPPGPRL